MKIRQILFVMAIILTAQVYLSAQTTDLPKLLEETQAVARKTAYQAWVEYTSDFKRIQEMPNGKKVTYAFESLCSRKNCVGIPLSKNEKPYSAKKIGKYRLEAAENLTKAEQRPDYSMYAEKENSLGYGIMILDWFNPSLYLKTCKSELVGKSDIEGRATLKISVADCNLENLPKSAKIFTLQFMTKTEGIIWIDEQDKAIAKMEIYARKEFPNLSKTNKPLVIIEASKIPGGFWFWKSIKVAALDNKTIFPQYTSNWEYEFYNYRLSNVEVNIVETNRKNDEKEK
jgi:hypothetical protein